MRSYVGLILGLQNCGETPAVQHSGVPTPNNQASVQRWQSITLCRFILSFHDVEA
jgi:hypothetical protein